MSHLGRLQRVLPLASRLAQAPGACCQFSDLASSLPGRGRGRGVPSDSDSVAPGSSSSSSSKPIERLPKHIVHQETAPTDSRYAEAEPHAAMEAAPYSRERELQEQGMQRGAPPPGPAPRSKNRRAGRMARLASGAESEEEHEAEGPPSEGAGRGGPRGGLSSSSGGGSSSRQAGGFDVRQLDPTAVWEMELPDPLEPGKARTVPAAEVLTMEELGMDPSRLWLLKYVLGQPTLDRMVAGQLGQEEWEEAAAKVEHTMCPSPQELDRQLTQYMQINWDPHYRLMDGVGATPRVDPGAGRASKRPPNAAVVLESFKEELMEMLDMGEDEFEEAASEAAAEFKHVRERVRFTLPRDQEVRLQVLLQRSVPADHPMYATIKAKLDVVAANPQWPGKQKVVFAKRLIKTLTGVQTV